MEKQTQIRKLLSELHFLTEARRAELFAKFETAPLQAQQQILAVLREAKATQDQSIAQKVHDDPTFLRRFHNFLKNTLFDIRTQAEREEKSHIDTILPDIDTTA